MNTNGNPLHAINRQILLGQSETDLENEYRTPKHLEQPAPYGEEELSELADILGDVLIRLSDTSINCEPKSNADRVLFAAYGSMKEAIHGLRLVAGVIA